MLISLFSGLISTGDDGSCAGRKTLGDQWALGLGVHYSFLQTDLLENTRSRLSTDIGITFSSIDKLLIGMLIMNFPSVSIGDKDIEIEDFNYYLIQISFQWEIINSLLITGSVGTENENLVVGNFGLEYTAFDSFLFVPEYRPLLSCPL